MATKDLNDLNAFLVAGEAGDFVFRQGDKGADMFLVRQGQIELLDETSGEPRQLTVLEAGDSFGEGQVFTPGPRTVSARSVTDYQAFRIDRPTLTQMVAEDATVALGIIERMASRPLAAPAVEPSRPEPAPVAPAAEPEPAPEPAPAGDPYISLADGSATFELTGKELFIVGRQDRATGVVPDIDLTAHDHDRALSRRHAQIVIRESVAFVREKKGSRNGTFVNGNRLEKGVDVELKDGAKVRFGLVEMVFGRRQ